MYTNIMGQIDDILRFSSSFDKLAQSAGNVATIPEVTIIGDPNAPEEPEPAAQPAQQQQAQPAQQQYGEAPITPEGKQNPNWKVFLAYVEKDPNRAKMAGLVPLQGYGYVLPQDLPQIQARLARGWKRAGGYGLVPPEWYTYLTQKGLV